MTRIVMGSFGLLLLACPLEAAEPDAGGPRQTTSATDPAGIFPREAGLSLPDGTRLAVWETPPQYSRTYSVDQNNPKASDTGEGTAEQPFRTINRAAQVVKAGERVFVKAGIYREEVQPLHGGEGPDKMVTFEAEPGHKVSIRGSCVLPRTWECSFKADDGLPPIWRLRLPQAEFAQHNPFAWNNVDEREGNGQYMEFAGVPPYTLTRGLLFQDDRRLKQVARYEDLAREAGAYWVDEDGRVLYARLLGEADPNGALMEATNRKQCFAPKPPGVSYVRVKGFVMEQVGNGFAYPVEAALSPMGGQHWIIEDNILRQVNTDGINLGTYLWVWGGNRGSEAGWYCVVRRNALLDCGVSGIQAQTPGNCLIEDNYFAHIGWQNVEFAWDSGCMKLLVCRNLLVRHNLMRDVIGAPCIWLDWDNINCRVTQNVALDTQDREGAMFIEASERTNWVDHNVIWNVKGSGIYLQDCDGLIAFNNLIGRCTDCAVRMQVCTPRTLYGRPVTARHNQVRHNIMVDSHQLFFMSDPDNRSDYNLIANARAPKALAAWQKASGKDLHSRQLPITATLTGFLPELTWAVPADAAVSGEVPGPFLDAKALRGTLRLFEPCYWGKEE